MTSRPTIQTKLQFSKPVQQQPRIKTKEKDVDGLVGGSLKSEEEIKALMTLPCLTDEEYIAQMTDDERDWMDSLIRTTDEEIDELRDIDQKSDKWFYGRKKRMTGSKGPAAVGHNPYDPLGDTIEEWVTGKSKFDSAFGRRFTEEGTRLEPVARETYECHLSQAIKDELARQWNLYRDNPSGDFRFMFRGIHIPVKVDIINGEPLPPVVKVVERGLLIDRDRRWRGVSLDGIVMIDDMHAWIIEIKCPQKDENKLYSLMPLCYYDQVMNNIYTAMYHFDLKLPLCDFFAFSEKQGWYVEPYLLDVAYMKRWFLPRESRCLFKAYLPRQVAYIKQLKEREQNQSNNAPTMPSRPLPPLSSCVVPVMKFRTL